MEGVEPWADGIVRRGKPVDKPALLDCGQTSEYVLAPWLGKAAVETVHPLA